MKEMLKERKTLARNTVVRTALALGVMACAALPCAAQSQDGPWLVRVRAVHLDSVNKDSTGLGLSINNKVLPELDISYLVGPAKPLQAA
jgi:outer membrane protein